MRSGAFACIKAEGARDRDEPMRRRDHRLQCSADHQRRCPGPAMQSGSGLQSGGKRCATDPGRPNVEPYTACGPGNERETNRSQYPGPQQQGEPPCSASLSRSTTI